MTFYLVASVIICNVDGAYKKTNARTVSNVFSNVKNRVSAQYLSKQQPGSRHKRDVTEKDIKDQLGIDTQKLKQVSWKDLVNSNIPPP
jgi:hypothetical protein